ncbi:MAG: hypothetical protein NVS3B10_12380 [Polyangiales bacterium]
MPLVRPVLVAAAIVVATSTSACKPKATLGKVDVGTRVGPKGALLPAATVDEALYLGCDVRFENLREGDEIKIEWRWKRDDVNDKEWRTSKRETVKGTGNGTLRADLGSDTGEIDPGVWQCEFHVFAGERSVATADATGRILVGRKD